MGNMATSQRSEERLKRDRKIVRRDGENMQTYAELSNVRLPYLRRPQTSLRQETWKEGLYPVEVYQDSLGPDDTIRVHYIGWDKKYDNYVKPCDLVRTPVPNDGILKLLAINIKEQLTGGSKVDSCITIRVPIHNDIDLKDVETLVNLGTHYKTYKDRTVYIIENRNSLCPALGESWDYRVVNSACDNYHVKTETVRFYVRNKRPLVDLMLFPDHTEDHFLQRGKVLTFSFVRCPGNKDMVPTLLSGNVL